MSEQIGRPDGYSSQPRVLLVEDDQGNRRRIREILANEGIDVVGEGSDGQAGIELTARLEPENLDRAEAAILAEIRRLQQDGVGEAERQRAIITAEANYAFDIETAEGLARDYGEAETNWTLAEELGYLTRLRQTTAAQIQAAARKYFGEYARVRFVPAAGAR